MPFALRIRDVILGAAVIGWGLGCDPRGSSETSAADPADHAVEKAPTGASDPAPPVAPRVAIPAGELLAGTRPGRFPRQPEVEPISWRVQLGEYLIDRAPYPNEPGKPPLLGLDREEAARRCAEADARLCTELEWERACSGPEQHPFATGAEWNESCGIDCASGFGVLGLGAQPEWTASSFGADSPHVGTPVIRGPVESSAPSSDHRCARRQPSAGIERRKIGFRCCRGAPNAARVTEPVDGAVFEKRPLDAARLGALLESHPKTAALVENLTLFSEPDGIETVISRGPGNRQGFDFTTQPLLWRPAVGTRFLVLTGKSGKNTSFVLAYHVAADDDYELAASFVMRNEEGPIVFAYSASIRPRLHFSDCWGCPGETGKILFRPPDSVSILQP